MTDKTLRLYGAASGRSSWFATIGILPPSKVGSHQHLCPRRRQLFDLLHRYLSAQFEFAHQLLQLFLGPSVVRQIFSRDLGRFALRSRILSVVMPAAVATIDSSRVARRFPRLEDSPRYPRNATLAPLLS